MLEKLVNKRNDFDHFIDRIFFSMLIGISAFGVKKIGDLSDNVQELNKTVGVIVEKVTTQERLVDKLDIRVHNLEVAPHKIKDN